MRTFITCTKQPDVIWVIKARRVRGESHVAHVAEKRNAGRVLAKTLEGKKPLGRSVCRWEDGIVTDLKEIEWDSVGWICHAEDRGKS